MNTSPLVLFEFFLQPGEWHPMLTPFSESLEDIHGYYHKHVLCSEEELWHAYMSSDPLEAELQNPTLLQRLNEVDMSDQDAVQYILATHPIPCRWILGKRTAPNTAFNELLKSTNGFLLYKSQAEAVYRSYTGCLPEEATRWVKQWNKKIPEARHTDYQKTGEPSMLELLEAVCYDVDNQFFYSEPVRVRAVDPSIPQKS